MYLSIKYLQYLLFELYYCLFHHIFGLESLLKLFLITAARERLFIGKLARYLHKAADCRPTIMNIFLKRFSNLKFVL